MSTRQADVVAQLNAALAEAFKDDPAGAVRAHAAVMPIIAKLAEAPVPPGLVGALRECELFVRTLGLESDAARRAAENARTELAAHAVAVVDGLATAGARELAGGLVAQPDTYFIIAAPAWPGGITMPTMDEALDFIARSGGAQTRLATWCEQYQRRDYSVEETRAMVAARSARTQVRA